MIRSVWIGLWEEKRIVSRLMDRVFLDVAAYFGAPKACFEAKKIFFWSISKKSLIFAPLNF